MGLLSGLRPRADGTDTVGICKMLVFLSKWNITFQGLAMRPRADTYFNISFRSAWSVLYVVTASSRPMLGLPSASFRSRPRPEVDSNNAKTRCSPQFLEPQTCFEPATVLQEDTSHIARVRMGCTIQVCWCGVIFQSKSDNSENHRQTKLPIKGSMWGASHKHLL